MEVGASLGSPSHGIENRLRKSSGRLYTRLNLSRQRVPRPDGGDVTLCNPVGGRWRGNEAAPCGVLALIRLSPTFHHGALGALTSASLQRLPSVSEPGAQICPGNNKTHNGRGHFLRVLDP
ncbi:hypothetical protein FKM82_029698 [Ascaphus truei]